MRAAILTLCLAASALTACGGAQRQTCYASAEAAAWADAERACKLDTLSWDSCEARQQILGKLAAAYRRCP